MLSRAAGDCPDACSVQQPLLNTCSAVLCRPAFTAIVPELEAMLAKFKTPRPRYHDHAATARKPMSRRRSRHHARAVLGAITRAPPGSGSSFMTVHTPRGHSTRDRQLRSGAGRAPTHEEEEAPHGEQDASKSARSGKQGGSQRAGKRRGPFACFSCL